MHNQMKSLYFYNLNSHVSSCTSPPSDRYSHSYFSHATSLKWKMDKISHGELYGLFIYI